MLDTVSDMLHCPICKRGLRRVGMALECSAKHSFNVAKQGYVDLLFPPGRKAVPGDTAEMVEARLALLEGGYFDPLLHTLGTLASGTTRDVTLADLGAGPGYYSRALLTLAPNVTRSLTCDVSAAAVRRAARMHDGIGAVRCDVRQSLPIRDQCVDLALVVFAPRNFSECRRILKLDGELIVVVPAADHLSELVERGVLLRVEENKTSRLLDQASSTFEVADLGRLRWELPHRDDVVAGLVGMGPTAHHRMKPLPGVPGPSATVTASVEVLRLAPKAGS